MVTRMNLKNTVKLFKRFILIPVVAFLLLSPPGGTDISEDSSPRIQISIPAADDSLSGESGDAVVTLRLFVDEPWWPIDNWNSRMCQWVTEQTGVAFDVTIADNHNSLDLLLTSGDTGDVIISKDFVSLSNGNVCWTFPELIDRYRIDFTIQSVYEFVNTADDGNIYTIMVGFSPNWEYERWPDAGFENVGICCRSDIYEALGSPSVNSLADLEAMMEACKALHPDVVPYTFNGDNQGQDHFLRALTGCYWQYFVELDGEPRLYVNDPNMENYYLLLNKWYLNGYIVEENFYWRELNTQYEWAMRGDSFICSFYCTTADMLNPKLENAGVDYRMIQLTEIVEASCTVPNYSTGWRGYFIPKTCSDPEAAIRYASFAYNKETQRQMMWGVEGVDWNWNNDQTIPQLNYDWMQPEYLLSEGIRYWGWLGHDGITNNLPYAVTDSDTNRALMWCKENMESNPVLGMLRFDADSPEAAIYNSITALEIEQIPYIATAPNKEECLNRYGQFIKQVEAIGGNRLEIWASERYSDLKMQYDKIKDNLL